MSAFALSDEKILRRVRETVDGKLRGGGLAPIMMRPSRGQKRPVEVPTLAPFKALKVSPSSTAHWVVEAQAAIQRGAASARVDPKEPVTQEGVAEASLTQMGKGVPPPCKSEARESGGAEAPSVAEATEVEDPWSSKAEAIEAGVPRTAEAAAAGAGAPETTEATVVEADVSAAKPVAQEVEMKAAEASMASLVQGLPLLWESAREAVDAEVAGAVEQPALTLGKGSSALMWSRDDPEGELLFALEDVAERGHWDTFEQYRQLAERSLRTVLSVVADDLPGVAQELEARSLGKSVFLRWERDIWGQLQWQKDLLARANELLSMWSAEVEDLRLRELEGEASRAAEASWVEVQCLKEKAEELEAEVTRAAEASVAVQAVLETEIGEHDALKSAARTAYEALEVEGV
ncbi:uncharacterized protein [Miscanthus floridulus]|uniref:uncharacterized protein n=1 Tax=Miscanthus floridulus TaxID=154761 RepID=UPI0034580EF7